MPRLSLPLHRTRAGRLARSHEPLPDDLAAARGITFGLIGSLALWGVIILLIIMVIA